MAVPKLIRNWIGQSAMEKLAEARAEFTYSRMKFQCDAGLIPILEDLLGEKKDGYYVDIGANDGRTFSNTWHLERSYNWRGVLVEPVLHLYFESKKIRSPENVFVNAACVDSEYQESCLEMIYAGLMTVSTTNSSFDSKKHAEAGSNFIAKNETIESIFAPVKTLDKILDMVKAPQVIDFLSIDVEGAEMSVLKGLDLKKWEFKVICIESAEKSEAHRHLELFGYKLHSNVSPNLIFTRKT
jgi:FkbM family methyltransferase